MGFPLFLVLAGLGIYKLIQQSNEDDARYRQREATTRTLIQPSQLVLNEVKLGQSYGLWQVNGTIQNNSQYPLSRFWLHVTVRDCPAPSCVTIELIGVEHKTPTEARLRLKTTSKGGGDQTTREVDMLPAVKEGDDWKLELTDVTRAITEMLHKRAALYSQVATGVRSGAFKDRISAMLALAEAQRGAGGKDN
jgi:hypothetical protein